MFLAGAGNLEANKAWINELNVFPVPDGDTGTNMCLTILSAVREVTDLPADADMKALCKAISSGSLRGARGNSGVILSQLLRGFSKVCREQTQITVAICADAFDKAVETAYKAVMKPKEGTILTVARGAAVKSRELADKGVDEFDEFIPQVIEYADSILASTPDMLPVLKQAGVVDSGGQGLVQLFKGALEGYNGKTTDVESLLHPEPVNEEEREAGQEEAEEEEKEDLRFIYAVDYTIETDRQFNARSESDFKKFLSSIAEAPSLVKDGSNVRISVYTNDPGLVVQRGILYGQLRDITVRNRILDKKNTSAQPQDAGKKETAGDALEREQSQAGLGSDVTSESYAPEEKKKFGIVAVAVGDGIADIFRGLGVDYIITGGQTMNPSTEDVLNAIRNVNADTVFVLPNNKNIVLAANQAAELSDDKQVIVIPSKNIPQGITAAISFMPDQDAEANRQNMIEEMSNVRTAEITYAVRDTTIDDMVIKQGNMMAIGDDGILNVGEDKNATALEAARKIGGDATELISIYYGADTTEDDANALRDQIAEVFPNCDVEVQAGGQPIYFYILSAE